MEDSEIIELYWARSESAITESANKYGRYLRSVSWRILRNEEDAAECVNDTWLRAWNAMPPHRPERLSAFLGKITRNLSLDLYKKKNRDKRGNGHVEVLLSELEDCLAGEDDVEQAMEGKALAESLNRFLAKLPAWKRNIFVLRYWYACPVQEIALKFGFTSGKVTTVLFRTRNELRNFLKREGQLYDI